MYITHDCKIFMKKLYVFLSLISFGLMITACASAPKKQVKVPVWKEVLGTHTVKKLDQVQLNFEVWSENSLAKTDVLESDLAATGLIAEVEGSGLKRSIVVGDVECDLKVKKLSQKAVSERVSACKDTLSSGLIPTLEKSSYAILISCKGNGLSTAIDSHNVMVSILKHSPGISVDLNQNRCGQAKKYNRFLSENFIRTKKVVRKGMVSIRTQGLAGFGFKEVSLAPLSDDRSKLAHDRLLSIADQILRIEGQSIGQEVQSGLSTAVYAPANKTNKLYALPKGFSDTYLLVNPKAKHNNLKAHKKFNYRFTQP